LFIEEIEQELFNSQETVLIRIFLPAMKLVDDLYLNVIGKYANWKTLHYYVNLIEKEDLVLDEANLEELKKLMLNDYGDP